MTFRKEQELKRDSIKVKAFSVMGVKDLDKGLSVSWFDDDNFKSEHEDEAAKHVTALTRRYEYDEDSCGEEVSYKELAASYKELCI